MIMFRLLVRFAIPVGGCLLALTALMQIVASHLPPRGDVLAFTNLSIGDENLVYRELTLMDLNTGMTHTVARTRERHFYHLDWSPDGRYIAYTNRNVDRHLYTIDLYTGEITTVVDDGADPHYPSWGPTGDKITFSASHADAQGNITTQVYVVNTDGTDMHAITDSPNSQLYPDWSTDGRHIVTIKRESDTVYNLHIITPDGTPTRQLTDIPDIYKSDPIWSPDDTRIAIDGGITHPNIYVVDATTGEMTLVAERAREPSWSPDGRRLVYIHIDNNDIYIVNADGTGPHQRITFTHLLPEHNPIWHPSDR